jgi:hypothetical protein
MSAPNLDPVENVTLEAWADINAQIVAGTAKEDAVKDAGMDMPKWDRVNEEWLARMKNDTTFTITKIYSAAFNAPRPAKAASPGAAPGVAPDSYPFDKYVEAMVAQDVLGKMGRDAQDVLKDFGLTVGDYSNVSAYWSGKMMTDFSLAAKMNTLMNQYKVKYESMKGADSNSDISF